MHNEFKTSGFAPVDCEANFKKGVKLLSKDGWSKTINFHGTIDRIDYNEKDNKYRVIDYKTGKYKTDEEDTYKQHIVYPLASDLKNVKMKREDITQFVYEYITSNNEDKMRKVKQGEELDELTDNELRILKSVLDNKDYTINFDDADKNKICKYCDYTDICNHRMGGEKYDE